MDGERQEIVSPDGQFRWDGDGWVPIPRQPSSGLAAMALATAVENEVAKGWRVEAQSTPNQVVLVRGHGVNNVLHLLLSILTLGLWLPVWLVLALTTHESRAVLTAQDNGTVTNTWQAEEQKRAALPWYRLPSNLGILAAAIVVAVVVIAAGD